MVSNNINKIVFFLDSRATFSYSNNVIKIFNRREKKILTILSGNYLEKKFMINNDIFKKNNIDITKKIKFKSPNKKK